jgi:hypothetical protein
LYWDWQARARAILGWVNLLMSNSGHIWNRRSRIISAGIYLVQNDKGLPNNIVLAWPMSARQGEMKENSALHTKKVKSAKRSVLVFWGVGIIEWCKLQLTMTKLENEFHRHTSYTNANLASRFWLQTVLEITVWSDFLPV